MRVFRGFDVELDLQNPVVAVGSFDGVHQGHCRILQRMAEIAHQCDGHSVVVTFDPHPREVLCPDSDFFKINTLERNLELMENQRIDAVVIIPFTKEFSNLSYVEFLETIVINKLHAHTLVMGPNHALGHDREGDKMAIERLCECEGIKTVEIPELLYQKVGVHSAEIRKCLQNSDFETASALLGYSYKPSKD